MLMRSGVLCLTVLMAGCQRPSPQTPPARANCPLAAEVEALHAVAFWLEHGEFTAAETEAALLLSQTRPLDKDVYGWGIKLQDAARRAANLRRRPSDVQKKREPGWPLGLAFPNRCIRKPTAGCRVFEHLADVKNPQFTSRQNEQMIARRRLRLTRSGGERVEAHLPDFGDAAPAVGADQAAIRIPGMGQRTALEPAKPQPMRKNRQRAQFGVTFGARQQLVASCHRQ